MPKWRKLHTKAVESLDINDMPDDFTRLLWVMLPLGLDCEGRGLDNPSWVKGKVMLLRTDVTSEMISGALQWYAERGMIERYTVNGRGYFWVPSFSKYQGNTIKEADSEYPPPPSDDTPELVKSKSGASPELVQSKSSTDVDVDVDVDSEEDTGADAPSSPPEEPKTPPPEKPKQQKRQRKRTKLDDIKLALEVHFANVTKLARPPTGNEKQRKSAGQLWWGPLTQLVKVCNDDVEHAKRLIDWAVGELDNNGFTVSSPKSILKTATAEQARRERDGTSGNGTGAYGKGHFATGMGGRITEADFTEAELAEE